MASFPVLYSSLAFSPFYLFRCRKEAEIHHPATSWRPHEEQAEISAFRVSFLLNANESGRLPTAEAFVTSW